MAAPTNNTNEDFLIENVMEKRAAMTIEQQSSALCMACRMKHNKLLLTCIVLGFPVNTMGACGTTPLFEAMYAYNYEGVRILIGAGATSIKATKRPGYNHGISWTMTAQDRITARRMALVAKGDTTDAPTNVHDMFDINTKDCLGRTLLHHAAANGKAELVSKLMSVLGADVNGCSLPYRTPIFEAIRTDHLTSVSMLISHGALRLYNQKRLIIPTKHVDYPPCRAKQNIDRTRNLAGNPNKTAHKQVDLLSVCTDSAVGKLIAAVLLLSGLPASAEAISHSTTIAMLAEITGGNAPTCASDLFKDTTATLNTEEDNTKMCLAMIKLAETITDAIHGC